jgi:hypothetical protein
VVRGQLQCRLQQGVEVSESIRIHRRRAIIRKIVPDRPNLMSAFPPDLRLKGADGPQQGPVTCFGGARPCE